MSDEINLVYSTPFGNDLPKTTWLDKDEEIKRLETENENKDKTMDALIGIYNKVVSLIIEKEKTIQKQQKIEKKIDCNECILKYIEAD